MDKVTQLDVKRQTLPTPKKVKGFTQISNHILLDQRLSFKARGILALLLSRPDDWQIYINEVTSKSDKDGKRAVQSGFKELVACGYLKLLPVYNDETGRFDGTYYHLEKSLFLPRQPHFRTVEKEDRPPSSPPEIQTDLKSDHPTTAPLSNKKSSNTKKSNKNNQQHKSEELIDVVDLNEELKKDISFFYDALLADTNWQSSFIGQRLSPEHILSQNELSKLLLHFKQTALKNGSAYENLAAAKRHFTNWFNANKKKKALIAFIEKQKQLANKARNEINQLIPKSDLLMDKLLNRECTTTKFVLSYKDKLLAHRGFYQQKLGYLNQIEEQTAIKTITTDIEKLCAKIDVAQQTSQLQWFCREQV